MYVTTIPVVMYIFKVQVRSGPLHCQVLCIDGRFQGTRQDDIITSYSNDGVKWTNQLRLSWKNRHRQNPCGTIKGCLIQVLFMRDGISLLVFPLGLQKVEIIKPYIYCFWPKQSISSLQYLNPHLQYVLLSKLYFIFSCVVHLAGKYRLTSKNEEHQETQ